VAKLFKVGDHVSWTSEAGRVRGRIVRVHKRDVPYKGYVHHASASDPQYEIKSDKDGPHRSAQRNSFAVSPPLIASAIDYRPQGGVRSITPSAGAR
jgi:hypothetical protein